MAFNWLKRMTSSSRFCINISHLNESETLITVMSEFIFCEGFSLGHVIITTIITLLVFTRRQERMGCKREGVEVNTKECVGF